ncbi:MAG: PspC domain-containing protein [Nocardioidaceae bacterium]
MTTTPPQAPHEPGPQPDGADRPRPTGDQLRDVSRLRRTVGVQRKVAGVAGGLARHFDIDPVIVRVAFVVLAIFGGGGVLLYIALWLLLPDDEGSSATFSLDHRSLSVVLVVLGAVAALALLGSSWGGYHFPWPLVLIGLVIALVVVNRQKNDPQHPGAPGPMAPPPPGAQPPPYQPFQPYQAYDPQAPQTQETTVQTPVGTPGDTGTTGTATYPTTGYQQPTYGTAYPGYQTYQPPTQPPYGAGYPGTMPAPFPPNPRKRGPILFWFTLALVVLALGVLGMVDVGGADIPGSAYPALATVISGVMLVVGSFFGRAGGIILLGLMSAVGLAGASVGEHVTDRTTTEAPQFAAGVQSRYNLDAGELVVDLTQVDDVQALDGRTIRIDGGAGRIVVIVPEDMDVDATAVVDGPGRVEVFGTERDGIDNRLSGSHDVIGENGSLDIHAELGIGEIEIRTR